MEDRDFIDFKFGDHWASDFNLLAVSSGDRYSPPVYGSVNPNTATIAGKVGVYKWKTQVNEKVFNIKIAFDNINGQILNQIKEWLNPFKIDKLVFKEEPYKYYWVALNTEPKLDFLPFLEETKVVNGIAFKEGVYKGEFELQFVCFDNYGYSDWQSFDENYDYVVKEIEGEEFISFNDGSDNNLIITKIEGNSKQRTREEVTGTVINGSEMTINEEYISNKTQFVIDGNSEQKSYSGKNLFNVNDKYRFSDGVTVDEDDWITVNVDNSEGTTVIYKNIYTNVSQKLKVDTTYTILYEIKEVKNITDGNNITLDLVNGYMSECQFNSGSIQNFNTLLSKKVVISRIATKSDFSNCTTMLRTLVTSKAGTTGSITFRISVLEEEVTENTFVYEPYVGGQPSPNPEYPQDIEVIKGFEEGNQYGLPYGCIGLEQRGTNYFNAKEIPSSTGIIVEENGKKIKLPIATTGNGGMLVSKKLSEFCPDLKVGDNVFLFADRNLSDGTNNYIIFSPISISWKYNTNKIITQDMLNSQIIFYSNRFESGETEQCILSNFRIVKNPDDDYEPYHSPKLYPINLNGNSIAKIGDVKDILKIYRNGDVEIEKRFEKIVLNGTEAIGSYIHDAILSNMYAFYILNIEGAFANSKILSSHFIFGSIFNSEESRVYCFAKNMLHFTIPKTIASTVNEVKTYLAEQYANGTPVTIEYEQAGPQTIKLPSIEPIELWEGTNNFKLITNLDTTMELTYNYLPAVPSIEEPSEIKNVTGNVKVKVEGKNLLDLSKAFFVQCKLNSDSKSITSNINNNYYSAISTTQFNEWLLNNKGKTITFSTGTTLEGKQTSIVIYGTRSDGSTYQEVAETGTGKCSITIADDFTAIRSIELRFNRQDSTFTDITTVINYAMLELGPTATDYEPYKSQVVAFPLGEEKLMEGSYLADDGIHHKRKQVVLDGSDDENWRYNDTVKRFFITITNMKQCNVTEGIGKSVCNIFIYNIGIWNDYNVQYGYVTNNGQLLVRNLDYNSVEEFKTALSTNSMLFEYELAEEEIVPYTTEQQTVYDEIKNNLYSYEGTNHIFSTDEVSPLLSISYVPKQDIYIDYVANQSNLLNDSAFYYNNDIYKKSYFDAETGDATKSGISEDRPVYLYNAGTTAANLNLTFDMIIPAEGSPLVINTESCKLTDNGTQVLKQVSSISISNFSKYKPFLEIYDGTPSNWQIQIDSNLCEIYLKHKTDKTKIISLNKFNDNQSFLSLANCNFVDYSKPFPTLITAISGTALENTVFNKLSVETSAQNYRLKNVDVKWKHTYL